jgi:hypothetical protein
MAGWDRQPTVLRLVGRAWVSAWDGLKAMPLLLGGAILLAAVVQAVFYHIVPLNRAMAVPAVEDFGFATLGLHFAARLVSILLLSAVAAPAAGAIYRFILLGERTRGLPSWRAPHTRELFFWIAGLWTSYTLAHRFPLVMSSVMFTRRLSELLVVIFSLIIIVQLSMVFPAIAIGVPARSAEKRIDASMRLMEGNFWRMTGAFILTLIPLIALHLLAALVATGGHLKLLRTMSEPTNPARLALGLTTGATDMVSVMVVASLLAWFYAWVRRV